MAYKLKNADKRMYDVTLEKVQKITKQHLMTKELYPLVRDTGRFILAFRTESKMEEVTIRLEQEGMHGDTWHKQKEEKFSFSDDNENYNIYVCEYKALATVEQEYYADAEEAYNAYHGIKEDGGRYSIHDVYSPSELGIKISY